MTKRGVKMKKKEKKEMVELASRAIVFYLTVMFICGFVLWICQN